MADSPDNALRTPGLWAEYGRERDGRLRSELIEVYMPLARNIAARVYGLRSERAASFDDYLQYARVGLIESIDRFDASRGVSFEGYAVHRIRGAILNGLSQESEAAAQHEFWRSRLADRTRSVVGEIAANPARASLRQLIDITVTLALGFVLDENEDTIVDDSPAANPYAAAELEQLSARLRMLVDQLPERERDIIKGHYFERLEFQVIAQGQAVTKGRVSQIHARALRRLREMLDQQPRLNRRL